MKKLILLALSLTVFAIKDQAQEINFEQPTQTETAVVVEEEEEATPQDQDYGIMRNQKEKKFVLSLRPLVFGAFFTKDAENSAETSASGKKIDLGDGFGLEAGLGLNFRFGRKAANRPVGTGRFGLEVEFNYAMYKYELDQPSEGEDYLKMNCLEVPILGQIYLGNFYFEAGPTLRTALNVTPKTAMFDKYEYETGKIKANDVMVTLGLGWSLPRKCVWGFRYYYGLSNIAENFAVKSQTLTAYFGWNFKVM